MKLTKKLLLAIILVITTLIIAPNIVPELQGANAVQAASIRLNKKSQTIYEGNTYTLKVIGTKTKAKWSSSNKKVATVNSKGIVTAKKNGTATITAKVGNKKLTCKVKVRLLQFNETFYSLEDASKAYIKLSKVKNSKTYKYDLDGDKKKDTITITKKNDGYSIKINGKECFLTGYGKDLLIGEDIIYIVDLNKNDKTTEIVVKVHNAQCYYNIWSKKGSKMKQITNEELVGYDNSTLKINKKGKILHDGGYLYITPKIYQKYYVFSNNKLTTKKLNINNNVKKQTFTTTNRYQYFTTKKVEKFEGDETVNETRNAKEVKKNTKFKILKFVDEKILNVQLSNGQKGYLFVSGGY